MNVCMHVRMYVYIYVASCSFRTYWSFNAGTGTYMWSSFIWRFGQDTMDGTLTQPYQARISSGWVVGKQDLLQEKYLRVIPDQNMDKISQVCLNIRMATNPRSKNHLAGTATISPNETWLYSHSCELFLPFVVACIRFLFFSSGTLHCFCWLNPQRLFKSYQIPILISHPRSATKTPPCRSSLGLRQGAQIPNSLRMGVVMLVTLGQNPRYPKRP
jgi:hypothetical protein